MIGDYDDLEVWGLGEQVCEVICHSPIQTFEYQNSKFVLDSLQSLQAMQLVEKQRDLSRS